MGSVKVLYLWYAVIRVIRALRHWHHYLICRHFVLKSDHEALHFLNSQTKVTNRQTKWGISFLQGYTFTLLHQTGKDNKVAEVLSRRSHMLVAMWSQARLLNRETNRWSIKEEKICACVCAIVQMICFHGMTYLLDGCIHTCMISSKLVLQICFFFFLKKKN